MQLAAVPAQDTDANRDACRQSGLVRWLAAAGFGLVATALGLFWLYAANTDLPPLRELIRDATGTYLSPSGTPASISWDLFLTDPSPGEKAWKLFWLSLDGQWDARLLGVGSAWIEAAALGVLALVVSRLLNFRAFAGVVSATLVLSVFSPLGPRPDSDAAWSGAVILLSLLHLGLTVGAGRKNGALILGFACGLLNGLLATEGFASAVALVIWCLIDAARERGIGRRNAVVLGANSALVAAGVLIAWHRNAGSGAGVSLLQSVFAVLPWPFENPAWSLVVWAPTIFILLRWLTAAPEDRSKSIGVAAGDACRGMLPLFAIWAIAQAIWLGAVRAHRPDEAREILWASLVLNACGFAALGCIRKPGRDILRRNTLIAGTWAILIGNALLQPSFEGVPTLAGPDLESSWMPALRRLVNGEAGNPERDAARLQGGAPRRESIAEDFKELRATGLGETELHALQRVLGEPHLRAILPNSIRPPLAVAPEAIPAAGFWENAGPDLPGRDGLPFYGNGRAAAQAPGSPAPANAGDPAGTRSFVSAPLSTTAPLVQIRVVGELRPPATSIVLQPKEGAAVAPTEEVVSAKTRWHRINFRTPRDSFRVVVRVTDPSLWIAFTAPQEIGALSWLAAKFTRPTFDSVIAAMGLVSLAAALTLGSGSAGPAPESGGGRSVPETRPGEPRRDRLPSFAPGAIPAAGPRIAWRAVPWLALFAYGVFFASHIDPTAGPNDSGGYLNSAKLLAHGEVTAAPKMIWGPAKGETDVTPYLPITFQSTKDGRMAPEYPVGFPLEVGALGWFMPLQTAVPVLILLQLVLGVLFTRLLAGAVGLNEGWAWLAAGIIGLSPVYLFQGLQPQSDGPAMVWVTAAVYFAWSSRERPSHALLAGLATAMAVLIRPSNVLCFAPILICLGLHPKRLCLWALSGLPGAAWQLWYNHRLYGNWFATGYGDFSTGFGWRFVAPTLASYARWLPAFYTPVVWLAFAGPWAKSARARARWALAAWMTVFGVFYAFYWCTYDNWYNMRFVMPAAPAAVILALFALRAGAARAGLTLFDAGASPLSAARGETSAFPSAPHRPSPPVPARSVTKSGILSAGLVTLCLGLLIAESGRQRILYWMRANREHAAGALWAREHLPANAVVFARHATGSLMYYTDLTFVRSDYKPAKSPEFFARLAQTGRPIFALNYHWERPGYKWENGLGDGYPDLPGNWEHLASLWDGQIHAWAWHPDSPLPLQMNAHAGAGPAR